MSPTVSVITPTWQRHDLLLSRCVPSVAAQDYPAVEHVIVSDGPDPDLRGKLDELPGVRFEELAEHDPAARWGHWARLHGIAVAKGEYITYLDDDDAYTSDHASVLAGALDSRPDAGFAYSRMVSHNSSSGGTWRVGSDPPGYGAIGTPMIMHRRSLLEVATWEQSLPSIDWDLVERWLAAGTAYVSVDVDTVNVWPSVFH